MTATHPISTLPDLTVEMSFTPPFATESWVDITQWVQAFNTDEGRQHELDQTQAGTLTLTLANLDGRFYPWNTSGPYAGEGGTGLVPQMPIRIIGTWPLGGGGTTYPLFYGFVDSWIPSWDDPTTGYITIGATDQFGLHAVNGLNFTYYADSIVALGPTAYYRCNDVAGPGTVADSSGHGNTAVIHGTMGAFGAAGAITTDISAALDCAGTGWFASPAVPSYDASTGVSIECWFKLDSGSLAGAFAFGYLGNPGSVLFGINGVNQLLLEVETPLTYTLFGTATIPADGGWHHAVATMSQSFAQFHLYLDGQPCGSLTNSVTGGNVAQPLWFGTDGNTPFNGQLDEVAVYPYVLSAAQVLTNYQNGSLGATPIKSGALIAGLAKQAGIPAGFLNIAAGAATVQPLASAISAGSSNLLDVLQRIAVTEVGLLYQAPDGKLTFLDRHYAVTNASSASSQVTFDDGPGATYPYLVDNFVPGLDNLDLWNEVIASAQANAALGVTGSPQVFEDKASQAQYGKRTFPSQTGLLFTTDLETLSFTQWLGARYKDPKPRIQSIQLDAVTNDGGNMPQMLGRKLWDCVTVIYNGLSGGGPLTQVGLIEGRSFDYVADPGTFTATFRMSPAEIQKFLVLDDPVLGKLDSGNKLAL